MELRLRNRLITYFFFFSLSGLNCNEVGVTLTGSTEDNIIVFKVAKINDSTNFYMYKFDGRSITAETYLGIAPTICSLNHSKFIVSGLFQDFKFIRDTLFIYTIYSNGIDSANTISFPIVQAQIDRFDSVGVNFDTAEKWYYRIECMNKTVK